MPSEAHGGPTPKATTIVRSSGAGPRISPESHAVYPIHARDSSGCSAAVAHMLWEPLRHERRRLRGGERDPGPSGTVAAIIVRFASVGDLRIALTARCRPRMTADHSPGGFARRAFSASAGAKVGTSEGPGLRRGWVSTSTTGPSRRDQLRDGSDLVALSRLLRPADTIDAVRYFTARVNGGGPDRARSAEALPRRAQYAAGRLSSFRPVSDPPRRDAGRGPGTQATGAPSQVLKTEEKGSDVNLATSLLLDGLDGLYESAVVISDDSDSSRHRHARRTNGSGLSM